MEPEGYAVDLVVFDHDSNGLFARLDIHALSS
jgi:hypothetical protein